MARRIILSFILIALVAVVACQGITLRRVNAELNEQASLNQQLLDIVNKHEYFGAAHHDMIRRLMVIEKMLPNVPMEQSVPGFLCPEGYTCPTSPVSEPKNLPSLNIPDPMTTATLR